MSRYFTEDHEWVDVDGEIGTVGISDYAQGQLGDIVFVDVPEEGKELTKGDEAAVVESVKAASDVYSPVSGTVIEGNAALADEPALVNSDPESDGWFFKLTLTDLDELDELMDEAAYEAFVANLYPRPASGRGVKDPMTVNAASRWDPQAYAANAAFVPALGAPVLALLAPRPGERILDIGCGDGVLTRRIVEAGAEVVAAARAKGLDARVQDCQALAFGPEFDAAFSNAALHWMLDKGAVARGVFAALRPGGRFVGEMGGDGNVAAVWRGVHAELAERGRPIRAEDTHWYPTVEDFTATYAAAGFVAIDARLIERPTPLPGGIAGWVRTFRSGLMDIDAIPAAEQDAIAEGVERRLAPELLTDSGWVADYVRLRFTMRKPT